jgi:hypothetical protein
LNVGPGASLTNGTGRRNATPTSTKVAEPLTMRATARLESLDRCEVSGSRSLILGGPARHRSLHRLLHALQPIHSFFGLHRASRSRSEDDIAHCEQGCPNGDQPPHQCRHVPRVRRRRKVQGPQVSQPILAFPLRARTRYPKGPTRDQVRDSRLPRQCDQNKSCIDLWTRWG